MSFFLTNPVMKQIQCALSCFSDDNSSSCEYVNLLLNPERYTGYAGASPNRIWNSIYEENCFK